MAKILYLQIIITLSLLQSFGFLADVACYGATYGSVHFDFIV